VGFVHWGDPNWDFSGLPEKEKNIPDNSLSQSHSQKKGTKAVTGAVPFQKVNFCPF